MMRKARVNSRFLKNGLRYIKALVRGRSDVQTGAEASPHGLDSNPVTGMVAIYAPTAIDGEKVVVGYLQENRLAEVGETHLYATDSDGNEVLRFKLLQDGTAELGGDADNLVRYAPLDASLQGQVNAINAELTKIASGITAAGGTYTPAPLSLDLSQAKIDELKSP